MSPPTDLLPKVLEHMDYFLRILEELDGIMEFTDSN
jgi:hypothetical protein